MSEGESTRRAGETQIVDAGEKTLPGSTASLGILTYTWLRRACVPGRACCSRWPLSFAKLSSDSNSFCLTRCHSSTQLDSQKKKKGNRDSSAEHFSRKYRAELHVPGRDFPSFTYAALFVESRTVCSRLCCVSPWKCTFALKNEDSVHEPDDVISIARFFFLFF